MSAIAHYSAKTAALSRSRTPDDPELVDARRNLAAERLADYIERTVSKYPPLTDEQCKSIAKLLQGGDQVA